MSIDTKKVTGRRRLRFESLDDLLADAEQLAAAEDLQLLGNWTLGQIFQHLASAIDVAIDGTDYRPPWFVRLAGPLIKRQILTKGMQPGFQAPRDMQDMMPGDVTTDQGLAELRRAVERLKREQPQPKHFVFGRLDWEQWVQLHLRHGELHLSFAAPAPAGHD